MSDIYVAVGNLLKKLTDSGEEIWVYPYDREIYNMVEGDDGNIYVAGQSSYTHIINKSGIFQKIIHLRRFLTKDYKGNIYGGEKGSYDNRKVLRYNINTGLIDTAISSNYAYITNAIVDDDGNIYSVPEDTKGRLEKYDSNGGLVWQISGIKSSGIVIDADGFLWFNNDESRMFTRVEPQNGITTEYDLGSGNSILRNGLTLDPIKQNIYFFKTVGLPSIYKFNILSETLIKKFGDRTGGLSISIDRDGYIYAGFSGGYLQKYDPEENLVWEIQLEADVNAIITSQDNHIFRGTVTKDGLPVEGAKVSLIRSLTNSGRARYTDAEGKYQFNGLVKDEYYHLCCEYEDAEGKYNSMSYPFVKPVIEG